MSFNPKKKTFLVMKIKEKDMISKEIEELFTDPNKFLKPHPDLLVGKFLTGPKFDENKQPIKGSYIGSLSVFNKHSKSVSSNKSKNYSSKMTISKKNHKGDENNPHFIKLDNKKLDLVFDKFKRLQRSNLSKENDFLETLPQNLKKNLKRQEQHLRIKSMDILTEAKVKSYIGQKINKKPNELLMSKLDGFRMKKEKYFGKNNESSNFGSKINWILSLRKKNKNSRKKSELINGGRDSKPVWVYAKETSYMNSDDLRINFKSEENTGLITSRTKFDISLEPQSRIFEAIEKNLHFNMILQGNNLLQTEYENAKILKNKKLIIKPNEAENYNLPEIFVCKYPKIVNHTNT